jgi:hypothetical protein
MVRRSLKALLRIFPVVLLAVAGWVLWRELHSLNPAAVAMCIGFKKPAAG